MSILVTGGAGYVGSVVVADLVEKGEDVVVIDNLVYGHRENVPSSAAFYRGNIGDAQLVEKILRKHEIRSCFHFSAFAYVGQSVENPQKYYRNNLVESISLFDSLLGFGVQNVVFSSTCATYGEPKYLPIDERHDQNPTNPYGWSKFMIERILESYSSAYGLNFVGLRYFNAAGATETLGERHDPETHLIPLVLQTALGNRDSISVYGNDYDTPDGTAVRDYIHISDLSQAHLLSLDYLKNGGVSSFFNLGNGEGCSVMEVIKAAERVTGRRISYELCPRRAGDPSKLVANPAKAKETLGWIPQIPEIDRIVESAWRWLSKHR
ncbi:MAG: UDP-glucose 4-epimerase GalE [Pyrinomonadaceae bacterium]